MRVNLDKIREKNFMTRLPISVCIIAGNEAHRISRALDSVAGWTAEIILVINEDVYDGTDKIAASSCAKIFREAWKGFGPQKQSAAEKCAQSWILNLDADETVSPELSKEIQKLFAAPEKLQPFAAFSFPRRTFYCGRWIRYGDWYPDRQIRLWRRGQAQWSADAVHEKLTVQGTIGRLRGDLLHFSMESLEQQMKKTMAYADAFGRQCAEQKKSVHFSDLLLRPAWRFVRAYFFRLGFFDGWQGFVIARFAAIYTFLRYLTVYQAQKEANKK
jgi:glycosyltransferase involved in cell wall biosynthesis